MPLPFTKNRDDGVGSSQTPVIERKPDEPKEFDMLDAVAEDLLAAIEKKDVTLVKEALSALASHISDQNSMEDLP